MLILLPPSEAKRTGGAGPRVDVGPAPLGPARRAVLRGLRALLSSGPDAAAEALLLPAAARASALADNRAVTRSPTMAAIDRYDGVLYRALDVPTLSPEQRTWAESSLVVLSGLFGAVRGDELIPAYRVPAAASLPGVGALERFWRAPLTRFLEPLASGGLVVDLRSTDYSSMWTPPRLLRGSVIPVRVLVERDGVRRAISFTGKQGKGQFARELIERAAVGQVATCIDDLTDAAAASGFTPVVRCGPALDLVVSG